MRPSLADAAEALTADRSEFALRNVIAAASGAPPEHVALLATALAISGERRAIAEDAADVSSTGGPGSLTTLLTSPLLVVAGWSVPKLGVPGRPAGGIDVLGSPGYVVDLDREEFESVLTAAGHAHARAGSVWAPADAALFALRQRSGAQAIPELVAASLIAKKIAAGVRRAVLDVRVSAHGNFGMTAEEGRAASRLFVDAAAAAGIVAVAVLSDAAAPQQPWIGRGEALVALRNALDGTAEMPLRGHVEHCARLTATIPGGASLAGDSRSPLTAFAAHLNAQGCSENIWRNRAAAVESADRAFVNAPSDGYLTVDMKALREALVAVQKVAVPIAGAAYADPAGVVLLVMPGEHVVTGTPVLAVRQGGGDTDNLAALLSGALSTGPEPPPRSNWHGEIIR